MIFKVGELLPNTPHLFADLAELLALINFTGRFDLHKNDLLTITAHSSISLTEVEDEEKAIKLESCDAEITDRQERQLEDVWRQLEYRQMSMNELYPFVVQGDTISLKTKLTSIQRVYSFLLACSRLRSFPEAGGVRQQWAKNFAKVSKFAMMALVPNHASVRIFDANSDDRRNYYSTDLRKALKIMGKDLGVPGIIEDECQKVGASGDAGFDLVATIKFGDELSSNFGILGQCGAQEREWPSKTLEAHAIKLRTFFHVHFDCPSVMFTPVFYRDTSGSWVDSAASTGIILLDRFRILNLLSQTNSAEAVVNNEWFSCFEDKIKKLKLD